MDNMVVQGGNRRIALTFSEKHIWKMGAVETGFHVTATQALNISLSHWGNTRHPGTTMLVALWLQMEVT